MGKQKKFRKIKIAILMIVVAAIPRALVSGAGKILNQEYISSTFCATRIKILTVLFLCSTALVSGQTKVLSDEVLSQQETEKLFTSSLNKLLGIHYPIRKVYKCVDRSGQFFIVLTESNDTMTTGKGMFHHKIKALSFSMYQSRPSKNWEINDAVTTQVSTDEKENAIWFWTKYSAFNDIDSDGLIDPIIVYGTSGMNHTEDGRIRILIFYKGKKFAIRHQNGTLDFERNTKVDKQFYTIPLKLQDHIKLIMENMTSDNNAIFPYGWQKAMKAHKTYFDEN